MDLEILLKLQELRNFLGKGWADFFAQITEIGSGTLTVIVLCAIFWSINKKLGTYLLMGYCWNRIINGFLKILVCCYRPWIRCPEIKPPKSVMKGATGYSFPSGHSTNAGIVYGGLAINGELEKKVRIFGLVILLLIPFSRIYFGVHTPQDVLTGATLSTCVMIFALYMSKVMEEKKNADLVIAAVSVTLAVATGLFAALKNYPVDYDKHGKILVDGATMAKDTIKSVGFCIGFFPGLVLERRFVNFTSDGTIAQRCLRFGAGLLGYFFIKTVIGGYIDALTTGYWSIILINALIAFYIAFLFPALIKWNQKKTEK